MRIIKKQKALHSGVGSGRIEGGERTGRRGGKLPFGQLDKKRRTRGSARGGRRSVSAIQVRKEGKQAGVARQHRVSQGRHQRED
ncbi:hypothetical protein ACFX19_022284 [Malus domestica]